jgi:hypothetical protein
LEVHILLKSGKKQLWTFDVNSYDSIISRNS